MKKAREKAGLTQADLSTKLGYSTPQFISNIERGQARLPVPKFKKLNGTIDTESLKKIIEVRVKSYRRYILDSITGKK